MFGKKNKNKNNNTRQPQIDAGTIAPSEETPLEETAPQIEPEEPSVTEVPDAVTPELIPSEEGFEEIPEQQEQYVEDVIAQNEAAAPQAPEEVEEQDAPEAPSELIEKETKEEEKAVIYSAIDDIDPDILSDSGSGEVFSRKAEKKEDKEFVENEVEPIKLELDKSEDAKPTPKTSKTVLGYLIVAIIAVILIVGFLVFTEAGLKEKFKSPLTINNTSIASDEFSFMYHYVLIENGVDVFDKDTKEMLYSQSEDPNFETNRDYFLDLTARELQIMELLYDDATKHGYDIEDKHYQMASAYIDWLQSKADEIGVPLDTYIQGIFGKQVTKSCIKETLAKKYFTEDYASDAKLVELQATADQAKEAYEANRNAYDLVSYKILRITYPQRDQAFIDTATLHANEIIEAMGHDASKFEQAASDCYGSDEELFAPDSRLVSDVRFNDIEHEEFRTWLFDPERVSGDATLFSDEDGFPIILCFVSREPQSTPLRSVRIIEVNSLPGDENGEGAVSLGDAQVLSQEIYDYIKDETTLMSVEAYFTDEVLSGAVSVSASTDTYPGKFSEQLDNWIFSPDRKAGDKDILEKEDGFYVVYFISESDKPEWYDRVNSFIRMNNYQAFLNEMLTEYTFEFKPSGLAQIVDVP